jgi:hypothetical protein
MKLIQFILLILVYNTFCKLPSKSEEDVQEEFGEKEGWMEEEIKELDKSVHLCNISDYL